MLVKNNYKQIKNGWDFQRKLLDQTCELSTSETAISLSRSLQKNHTFYKHLYSGIDIKNVSQLPLINKSSVINNIESFYNYAGVKHEDVERYLATFNIEKTFGNFFVFNTSGSSGKKSTTLYSLFDFGRTLCALFSKVLKEHNASRMSYIGLVDRYNGGNQWMHHLSSDNLQLQLIDYFKSIDDCVNELLVFQPEVIFTKPTKLKEIGFCLSKRGECLHKLKHIISVGENISAIDASEITALYNIKPHNSFSSTEMGPIAYQVDPDHRILELYSSLNFVEIVDEDNNPITEEEVYGRLVVSNLYNKEFPLIRYDLADYVCWQPGRVGKTISFIVGRAEKVLKFNANGMTGSINELLLWRYHHHQIRDVQFVQMSNQELNVNIVLLDNKYLKRKEKMIHENFIKYLDSKDFKLKIDININFVTKILSDPVTSKVNRILIDIH